MCNWQPIETAPRDGTVFQAWINIIGTDSGFWEPHCKYRRDGKLGMYGRIGNNREGWDYGLSHLVATYWMALPDPPG